jgi:hypothetical protein
MMVFFHNYDFWLLFDQTFPHPKYLNLKTVENHWITEQNFLKKSFAAPVFSS